MSPVETAARIVAVDGCRPAARDDFRDRSGTRSAASHHACARLPASTDKRPMPLGGRPYRTAGYSGPLRYGSETRRANKPAAPVRRTVFADQASAPDGRHSVRLLRRRQHGHDRHGASRARNHAAGNDDGRSQQEQQRENQLSVDLLREPDRRGLSHRNTYRDKGSKFRNHPESREVRANRESGRDRPDGSKPQATGALGRPDKPVSS